MGANTALENTAYSYRHQPAPWGSTPRPTSDTNSSAASGLGTCNRAQRSAAEPCLIHYHQSFDSSEALARSCQTSGCKRPVGTPLGRRPPRPSHCYAGSHTITQKCVEPKAGSQRNASINGYPWRHRAPMERTFPIA